MTYTPQVIEVPISKAGAPTTGAPTTPYRLRRQAMLYQVVVSLGTAGATDSIVTFYKNGVSIGTVTVAANATTATGVLSTVFSADSDEFTSAVTTLGTGAIDFTIQARFR